MTDPFFKEMVVGKYVGVTLTHVAKVEEYAAHALAKTAHSSTSQLGKCLHKTAGLRTISTAENNG